MITITTKRAIELYYLRRIPSSIRDENLIHNKEVRDKSIIQPHWIKKWALAAGLVFSATISRLMHLLFTIRGQDPPYWIQSMDHIFGFVGGLITLIGIFIHDTDMEFSVV